MSKDMKELLIIIDNLEDFADKLLKVIADESELGAKRLISILNTANENYKKPIDSWLMGWFYQYTRLRTSQVDKTIQGIKAFPDAVTRLQEFKLLILDGKWNEGSFNVQLLDELIHIIPGYQVLKPDIKNEVILRLKELLIMRIDHFINDYQIAQKQARLRKVECENSCIQSPQPVDNIYLFNNMDTALSTAVSNIKNEVFFYSIEKKSVKLKWIDFLGGIHAIHPTEELSALLVNQKIDDLTKSKSLHYKNVKKECVKSKNNFLDGTKLVVNPVDLKSQKALDNETLKMTGLSSTFILRGQKNIYSLCWVNSLGKFNPINLEDYPRLNEWLLTQETIKKEHEHLIKTYLTHVQIQQSLGMEQFKKELSDCLSQGPKSVVKHQEPIAPKRIDVNLFKNIESCLNQGHPEEMNSKGNKEKTQNQVGRLNAENYEVAKLFGNKAHNKMAQHGEELQSVNFLSK